MNYRDFFKEDMLPSANRDNPNYKDKSTDFSGAVSSFSAVKEPDASSVDKQTVPVTVFPPADKNQLKDPTASANCGINADVGSKSDVDSPTKDPTATDHVTGGMSSTPVNPNILPKSSPQVGGNLNNPTIQSPMDLMTKSVMPTDISIDIAESKRLLNKMMKEATIGPKNAFGFKKVSNENDSVISKEGYGGDPDKDDKYVKGKRWTVKWSN